MEKKRLDIEVSQRKNQIGKTSDSDVWVDDRE